MSKLVLVCPRLGKPNPYGPKDIDLLSRRLCPDNISPNPPAIIDSHGLLAAIVNPTGVQVVKNGSVCMGVLLDPRDDWWKPGAEAPDGLYALLRSDEDSVELLTDTLASRSIWYVQTEDLFIASSSQRAIVCLLRDFRVNKAVMTWLLCTGTLGPGLSWDARIKLLTGSSRLRLDRASWKLTVATQRAVYEPDKLSEEEHNNRIREALEHTFKHLEIRDFKWILPLSGGCDSRAILLFLLRNNHRPRCVTWGIECSLSQEENDAWVARSLAQHFGLKHRYFVTDPSDEPARDVLDRFIKAADGRIDHLEAYMDGFRTWKAFSDEDVQMAARGDEVFGQPPVATALDVREICWISTCSDYPNLGNAANFGLEEQELPGHMERQQGESLSTWRDRLFDEYTMPFCYGALNEIMSWYVDIVNPLVSRRIVQQIRRLPDALRTNKILFRNLVRSLSPVIDFSKFNAIGHQLGVRRTPGLVEELRRELDTASARELLSDKLINLVLANVAASDGVIRTHQTVHSKLRPKDLVPWGVRRWLRSTVWKAPLDWNMLAFRAYLISRMNEILSEDARALEMER